MNQKIIFVIVMGLFLITGVSASSVNFFYSPSCPHCNAVKPLFDYMQVKYQKWQFNLFDISQGSYNIDAVPKVIINTKDKREIILTGSQQIPQQLECELQEMSTPECVTYSSDNSIGGSWFIW